MAESWLTDFFIDLAIEALVRTKIYHMAKDLCSVNIRSNGRPDLNNVPWRKMRKQLAWRFEESPNRA